MRRRGTSSDKNQYNIFCRYWGFEYFSLNIFFEKNNIFRNRREKLFLAGMTIFEGARRQTTKMNISVVFWETKYRIQFLSFFLKKPHTIWLKPKKLVWGYIFPHICGSTRPIVSFRNHLKFTSQFLRHFFKIFWQLYQNFIKILHEVPRVNSKNLKYFL